VRDFANQSQRTIRRAKRKHHDELRDAYTKAKKHLADIKELAQQTRFQAKDRLRRRTEANERQRPDDLHLAGKRHTKRRAEIQQRLDRDTRELQARRKQRLEKIETAHAAKWQGLIQRWQEARAAAAKLAEEMNRTSARLFPAWDDASWKNWAPVEPLSLLES